MNDIEIIKKVLLSYQDALSDGFQYYCIDVDKTLEQMANEIITELKKGGKYVL